ncbi:DUF551 domain-containing protein [Enterobacter ludwigii]
MSTITREWLHQTIAEYEANRDELPFGLDTNSAIELQAFKLALASLEAEPVAWRYRHHNGLAPSNWRYVDIEIECNMAPNYQRQPLYIASPAPVVPDKRSPRDMEMLLDETGAEVSDQDLELVLTLMSTTWNECRAAMPQGAKPVKTAYKLPANTPCKEAPEHIWLQTAGVWPENGEFSELTWCSDNQHQDDTLYVRADVVAGNSPVVPDGWVACSERMPESDDFVYIWPRPDFGVELHVAQYGKFDKRDAGWYAQLYEQNYGIEYYPIKVTHWMALPAAPQQEVKP